MSDREEEKIENILRYFWTRRKPTTGRADCPDEETLANYLEQRLEGDEAARLEGHFGDCLFCAEHIVAVHASMQGTKGRKVFQRILERAMALVPDAPPPENVLDIVVRLVKNSLELVNTSGRAVLMSSPVGIRARPQTADTAILQVEKDMSRFKVKVEVEQVEVDVCQIVVRVAAEENRPADNIRLTLFSGNRERASYLTRQGQAVFDGLPHGVYSITVSDSGTLVGTIRLDLNGLEG